MTNITHTSSGITTSCLTAGLTKFVNKEKQYACEVIKLTDSDVFHYKGHNKDNKVRKQEEDASPINNSFFKLIFLFPLHHFSWCLGSFIKIAIYDHLLDISSRITKITSVVLFAFPIHTEYLYYNLNKG